MITLSGPFICYAHSCYSYATPSNLWRKQTVSVEPATWLPPIGASNTVAGSNCCHSDCMVSLFQMLWWVAWDWPLAVLQTSTNVSTQAEIIYFMRAYQIMLTDCVHILELYIFRNLTQSAKENYFSDRNFSDICSTECWFFLFCFVFLGQTEKLQICSAFPMV